MLSGVLLSLSDKLKSVASLLPLQKQPQIIIIKSTHRAQSIRVEVVAKLWGEKWRKVCLLET